jgi:hypothetical protein
MCALGFPSVNGIRCVGVYIYIFVLLSSRVAKVLSWLTKENLVKKAWRYNAF